jgi:hypothetical protein
MQISPYISEDVVKNCSQAYFLFHMVPSWIKCFRHLIGVSFRGRYRGSSIACCWGASIPKIMSKSRRPAGAPQTRAASLKWGPCESKAVLPVDTLAVIPLHVFAVYQSPVLLLSTSSLQKSCRICAFTCTIGSALIGPSRLLMTNARG